MFVNSDLIAYFIDFIMEKQSPLNVYQKKYSLGTKSNPVVFSSGLNLIFFLLKRVKNMLYSLWDSWAATSKNLKFRQQNCSTSVIMRSAV
jgi:hypothetical protein